MADELGKHTSFKYKRHECSKLLRRTGYIEFRAENLGEGGGEDAGVKDATRSFLYNFADY